VLSQEFVNVCICNRNVFFGQISLNPLFYHFVRQERILLSILTEASTYVTFVRNANCSWKLHAAAFESYVPVNLFWCLQKLNVFCCLGLSAPTSRRHQESGVWNTKEKASFRMAIICDIVPYSRGMIINVWEYCCTSIFAFRTSGVVSSVVIIPHLMSWEKKCVELYSTPHVPLRHCT